MNPLRRYAFVPAVLLAALLYLMTDVGLHRAALPTLAALYAGAFLAFVWAWSHHRSELERPGVIILWAVVFRALLLPTLPDLSDDPFRYVWDGWLVALGVNPYLFLPVDPALVEFRDGFLLERLNSPEYHSVYPPFSQVIFFFGGLVYEILEWPAAFFTVKGLTVLLELAGIALMIRVLRAARRPVGGVALYAWNPLVLVTVAGNAHSEGIMVLGVGLLAAGVYGARSAVAWIGLVLAGMTKLVPFVGAPLLLRNALERGHRIRLAWGLAMGTALAAILVLPFWSPEVPGNVAASLQLYVRHFEFNGGLYLLLKEAGLWLTGEDPSGVLGPALAGLFLLWLAGVTAVHRTRSPETFFRAFLLVVTGYLVLATTVHPWYLLWALVLLPFTRTLRNAWLWASFAAFGTYFTYLDVPHGPLTALVWVGFAALVLAELVPAVFDRLLRWAGRRKARGLAPHLGDGRVLDLGAGEGYVGWNLRESGRRVVLADVAPFFRAPLPAVLYDGQRLPFPDDAFDTVVLSLVLHHCRDPEAVVAEALRTARHRVVITESVAEGPREARLLGFLDRSVNRFRGAGALRTMEGDLRFRSEAEWRDLFRQAGGEVTDVRILNRRIHRHVLFALEPAEVSLRTASRTGPP